jgi:transcriptional regulator with XRE-family HTH domain
MMTANDDASAAPSWHAQIVERFTRDEWTYNGLASAAGIPPATVMRFIKGERDITLSTAEKLCMALGLVLAAPSSDAGVGQAPVAIGGAPVAGSKKEEAAERGKAELLSIRRKFADLPELADMWKAIDSLLDMPLIPESDYPRCAEIIMKADREIFEKVKNGKMTIPEAMLAIGPQKMPERRIALPIEDIERTAEILKDYMDRGQRRLLIKALGVVK